LKANLSGEGFEVMSAFRGDEALCKASEKHPDLILLDILMPELDGLEVCRRLKRDESTSNIPVIMLTCLQDQGTRLESLRVGANDYVVKPFLHEHLLKSIKKTLLPSILLVDDCEELSYALKMWFEEKGYKVTVATNGYEAISLLEESAFHLALLDYNLGFGPTGVEVFNYIKENEVPVKTLFMTSEFDRKELREACLEGALGIIQKPFRLKAVEAEVRRLLIS
jgi:DNA-binding response OmpR family regulator